MVNFWLQIPQGKTLKIGVDATQYTFHLNQQVVQQIQEAKRANISLYIPRRLLIYLWLSNFTQNNQSTENSNKLKNQNDYQFILTSRWNQITFLIKTLTKILKNRPSLSTGITFTSAYIQEILEEQTHCENYVLQSLVMFDGDIIHKIKRDLLLTDPNSLEIINAHYWLTEQFISSLRNQLGVLSLLIFSFINASVITFNVSPLLTTVFEGIIFFILLTITTGISTYTITHTLRKVSSVKADYLDKLPYIITYITSNISIIFYSGISSLVFSAISIFVITKVLSFVFPKLGKFMMRRLLSI